jgi:glutathione S-transferase
MAPRVYRIPFSTNVERVALAAGHKGIELEWVDVHPRDRSPVVEASGQELVPVLVDGDQVVYDSPVILDWLEQRQPEPSLYPADQGERAAVRVFVQWFNLVWKGPPNLIADELEKPQPNEALVAELGERMRSSLRLFEDLLHGRDYLFGAFGAADVIAFPFLKYAALGLPPDDDELFHQVLVDRQPLGTDHPNLRSWVTRVDAHPRA